MGLVLYANAFGLTLLILALITITFPERLEGYFAGIVTGIVSVGFVTLTLFSVLWIIFVEAYKALG